MNFLLKNKISNFSTEPHMIVGPIMLIENLQDRDGEDRAVVRGIATSGEIETENEIWPNGIEKENPNGREIENG